MGGFDEQGFIRAQRPTQAGERAAGERDNIDVRLELVRRVKAGEITLEEAQKQIRKLKHATKKDGEKTYYQRIRSEKQPFKW